MDAARRHGHNSKKGDTDTIVQVTGLQLGWFVIFWASFACIACVLMSLLKDFESSTSTYCAIRKTFNYLPSISAAAGDHTPQRYIWRLCMGINFGPRLVIAAVFHGYYKTFPVVKKRGLYEGLANLTSLLHFTENMGLVGLSFVSSSENLFIHEASFAVFLISATFHMITIIYLFHWSRQGQPMTVKDRRSYHQKMVLFALNVACFVACMCLYVRHNTYCESGVYTAFAALEYCVIGTNIAFHHTSMIWDMGHMVHMVAVPNPYHELLEEPGMHNQRGINGHVVHGNSRATELKVD